MREVHPVIVELLVGSDKKYKIPSRVKIQRHTVTEKQSDGIELKQQIALHVPRFKFLAFVLLEYLILVNTNVS